MKNKAKLFGIYLPVFAVLLTAVTVLRTVALLLDFNFKTGYFLEKTLSSISVYITVAAAVFFLTYIFTARRDMKLIPDFTSPATYVPTGIVSVALIFMITWLLSKAYKINETIQMLGELAGIYPQARAELATQRLFFIIIAITTVFAVLSIVHFILTALVEKNSSTKRAGYGIFTVLFLSFYGLYLYFSTDLPINAPNKALDQMTSLLAAVFFLYETRLSLGREKWRPYISFGFISSFVGIYASLPAIILYFAKGEVVSSSIYESAFTLAISGFILSRILLTGELIEDKPSDTVRSLLLFADAREEAINPAPSTEVIDISGEVLEEAEAIDDEDGNQITIEDVAIYADRDETMKGDTEETPDEASDAPKEVIENGTVFVPSEEKE